MAGSGQNSVFLERAVYRRRRLADALRLLPVLGGALLLLPVLWADEATTSGGIVYLFVIWAILIALAAVLSRRIDTSDPTMDDPTRTR